MTIIKRLRQLSDAVAEQDWREFTMRIPVEPDRDADIVLMHAADLIEAQAAQIEVLLKALNAVNDEDEDFWILVETALTITPNEALQAFAEKVRDQCAQVCDNERLEEAEHEADRAYNMAIKHCTTAIRHLKELPK